MLLKTRCVLAFRIRHNNLFASYLTVYTYTYICIYSERERERGGEQEREIFFVHSNSHNFGEENVRAQMFIFES